MNSIVVDDNEIIRKQIASFIERVGSLSFCGGYSSPIELNTCIEKDNVSLIFLDIEMPLMTGFDYLEKVGKNVQIVIISGSRKYALEAYNYRITDYLLKPIKYERFVEAVNKCIEKYIATNKIEDSFYFKVDGKYQRLDVEDIYFVRKEDGRSVFVTDSKNIISDVCVENLVLSNKNFTKINSSSIINLKKVRSFGDDGAIELCGKINFKSDDFVDKNIIEEFQRKITR